MPAFKLPATCTRTGLEITLLASAPRPVLSEQPCAPRQPRFAAAIFCAALVCARLLWLCRALPPPSWPACNLFCPHSPAHAGRHLLLQPHSRVPLLLLAEIFALAHQYTAHCAPPPCMPRHHPPPSCSHLPCLCPGTIPHAVASCPALLPPPHRLSCLAAAAWRSASAALCWWCR